VNEIPDDFVVTPWEVTGQIDYEKLIVQFGTKSIDGALVERLAKYAEPHLMLRRGIFFSHRDFDTILTRQEKGLPWYMYTGRGPSGHTHLGHLMPWIFTKWLQDVFKVRLYFQLTDDEKFFFGENLTQEDSRKFAYENALDIIALGFDPKLTKIFLDTEYIHNMYPIASKVAKKVTFSTAKAVFGFTNSNNLGEIFYTSMQSATAFLLTELEGREMPCVIPCGIDQDAHFRVARDVAPGLGYPKPVMLHCKLFPSLQGGDKMSASKPETTIFTTDPPKTVKKKIMNAFTGGAVSVEEQKKNGGNPDVCSVHQYLYYLFEEDTVKFNGLTEKCRKGEILCGQCKQYLAEKVVRFIEMHQERREAARDRLDDFMLRDCQGERK